MKPMPGGKKRVQRVPGEAAGLQRGAAGGGRQQRSPANPGTAGAGSQSRIDMQTAAV